MFWGVVYVNIFILDDEEVIAGSLENILKSISRD